MTKNPGKSAIVIGGSIAGLAAALLLRRDGWTVDIYERSESALAGRGAGIVTHADLFAVLAEAGVAIGPESGVSVTARRVFDADGSCLAEMAYPQVLTSWDRLYDALRAAFPPARYHLGHSLRDIRDEGDAVVARFANGVTRSADLLVGADGFRSAARGRFMPEVEPQYAGYVAWRGLVAEADIAAGTHRDLFSRFAFSLPAGEQMLGYPVAGADNDMRPGKRRYNWVWYRAAGPADLRDLLRDGDGTVHDLSIPPPLIRAEVLAAMRAAADRVLAPQFAELVRLTHQPFFQPIYDLEAPRLAIGRVALIGDAAFVARPHVGAGVTKAAQDAFALAAALRGGGDVATALRSFERERLAVGRRIIARARQLGAYMQSQTGFGGGAREDGRSPASVMRDTASLDFLRQAPEPEPLPA
jgi:2-polyprenyl-6-methoxyphenol hydroxylase-like FAD-dependent oxidoreductase